MVKCDHPLLDDRSASVGVRPPSPTGPAPLLVSVPEPLITEFTVRALVDLFFNYRSQLFGRNVSYNVKVNNLLNENPYVVFNGTWGDPLEVKAAMRIEF